MTIWPPPQQSRRDLMTCSFGVSDLDGGRPGWLAGSKLSSIDRQLSQALAGCRKDRVGLRGNDGRSPGLTHPARRLDTLDDVHLDGRRLIHAQDLVGIEVGLLDTAVRQRDLAIDRRRDTENDRTLDLRLNR